MRLEQVSPRPTTTQTNIWRTKSTDSESTDSESIDSESTDSESTDLLRYGIDHPGDRYHNLTKLLK